jgi:hypothetical protein
MSRERVIRALAAVITVMAAVVAVGGCGSSAGSSSGTGADPASIAPAGSVLYFSAVVRPTGSLATGAVSAAQEISHLSDPFGKLRQSLQAAATGHGAGIDYANDIAPWLGSRVGVFVVAASGASGAGLSRPAFAAIADATNSAKAMAFIEKVLRRSSPVGVIDSHSYRGTSYDTLGPTGQEAGGIVKGFAVYGTVTGVRAAIDTASGGPALAAASAYQGSGADTSAVLAGAYVNFNSLLHVIADSGIGGTSLLGSALGGVGPHSFGLTFSASGSSLAFDAVTSLSKAAGAQGQGAAQTLAALPGDAWLGVGLGNLGADVTRELGQFGGAAGGLASAQELFALLDSRLHGLNIERDILPWLGSAGLFLTGGSVQTLGGALVVHSTRPTASKAAVGQIRAALAHVGGIKVSSASVPGADAAISVQPAGSSLVVYVVDGNGRFAVALGSQAAAQALRPTNTLAGSSIYHTATGELGAGFTPTLLVSIPSIASLVLPRLPTRAAAEVRPYLGAFTVLAAGAQHSGSRATARLVVGLH